MPDANDWKPAGYSTVSPYLIVEGADTTIGFLERAFGAREIQRFADEGGRIMHAEVRLEDTVIMLGEAADGWSSTSHMHVYVEDVDASYARAIEAGGTSVREPTQGEGDDTDRRGGVMDPGGTTWWLATHGG